MVKHINSGIQPAPCKILIARIDEFMSEPPPFFLYCFFSRTKNAKFICTKLKLTRFHPLLNFSKTNVHTRYSRVFTSYQHAACKPIDRYI